LDLTGLTVGWTRQHNGHIQNLYVLLNNIRVMRSRMVRWAEHIARMGVLREAYSYGWKT